MIEDIQDRLHGYKDLGFDRVILGPAASDADELNRQMDLITEHLFPELS
jgi:hypothetical protein